MENLLKEVFKENRFLYVVFRSVLVMILILVTVNSYFKMMQESKTEGLIVSLVLFLLIYVLLLRKELK